MASAVEIARQFFPTASDAELDYYIWNETGFPHFWPDRNLTPGDRVTAYRSDLRDLAEKIQTLAQNHIAYPKAREAITNLGDHLCAMAGHEEALRQLADEKAISPK